MKFLLFVLAVVVGVLLMKYTDPLVRLFGKSPFAEQYLGSGGSYTLWKLIAVILIILALVNWVGWHL